VYLKSIEMVGFKSFADRTVLQFEPGMTAIVGPNGCGKSNISDAVRWVLGEQSPKALRGGAMTDVIFNGTDSRKPLGMAEVSITLGACEQALGMEFHEVTVTRRVLRSGEGQYFINKQPCRLRDIQRLFMDTGVGTNSYSMMEQGRIDQVLSSRPEDRREVFEEASGITKFKADKKEALRKLEHTEANLLRLADIIKEVRRQIISLQRQAGKARRYQEIHERLRRLDIFYARQRLDAITASANLLESKLASISERDEALRQDVDSAEEEARQGRAGLAELERHIAATMEAAVQARTELSRLHELMDVNRERIKELAALSERDTRDAAEAEARIREHGELLVRVEQQLTEALRCKQEGEAEFSRRTDALHRHEELTRQVSDHLEQLRIESLDLESRLAHLQNELADIDSRQRSTVLRRERLAAEQSATRRTVQSYQERQSRMSSQFEELQKEAAGHEAAVAAAEEQRADQERQIGELDVALHELMRELAAKKAQVDLLDEQEQPCDGFPGGARWLLDPHNRDKFDHAQLLGALAEQVIGDPGYQLALEAALRAWLDAIVVRDMAAVRSLLCVMEDQQKGSVRMLALEADAAPLPEATLPGERLVDHIQVGPRVAPLVERILGAVRVVEGADDLPAEAPHPFVFVTRSGSVLHPGGQAEFWGRDQGGNPLSRQHSLRNLQRDTGKLRSLIDSHAKVLDERKASLAVTVSTLRELRARREEALHRLALREGECQIVAQEAEQARQREETVSWELNALDQQDHSGSDRRTEVQSELERLRERQVETRAAIKSRGEEYRRLDEERQAKLAETTDFRIRLAEHTQEAESQRSRRDALQSRVAELRKLAEERRLGIDSYKARMDSLELQIQDCQARVAPYEQQVRTRQQELETAREGRQSRMARLSDIETQVSQKRTQLDEVRATRSHLEVELAEERMRRENLLERVTSEYRIAPEQIAQEAEPEWEDGQRPDRENLETMVAELRTRLESMGPVNLVAIEEHKELEERYAFLTKEQDDLHKAKQQLIEMIRKINKTTTEMFSQTFEAVNANFQVMFKKLFGGGSAKLVLLDEQDVLESGIEIIARPPGKKLQTVSLLSGGERTMTAVALLFSLYMVKPSPFCMLDELDAALDDANIGRFVKMLDEFIRNSQFIVVTHNRQTISAAGVLYGVTMNSGVSSIISVKFSHHEKPVAPATPSPEPVASE